MFKTGLNESQFNALIAKKEISFKNIHGIEMVEYSRDFNTYKEEKNKRKNKYYR